MSGVAAHAQIDTALDKTVWKMAFGLTDAQVNDPQWLARDDDGDGMSNGGEFRAGTNPLQASSTLSVKAVSANERTVALTFPTVRGKLYAIESRSTLQSSTGWAAFVPAVQATGNGNVQSVTAPRLTVMLPTVVGVVCAFGGCVAEGSVAVSVTMFSLGNCVVSAV